MSWSRLFVSLDCCYRLLTFCRYTSVLYDWPQFVLRGIGVSFVTTTTVPVCQSPIIKGRQKIKGGQ